MNDFASDEIFLNAFSSYSNSPHETFNNVSLSSSPINGEIPLNLNKKHIFRDLQRKIQIQYLQLQEKFV